MRERFLREGGRVALRGTENTERLVGIVERTYASISSLSAKQCERTSGHRSTNFQR